MKNLILHDKAFTVFITISYIFGIIGFFYKLELLFAVIVFVLLLALLFGYKYSSRKLIALYFIFFLGLLRSYESNNLDLTLGNFNVSNVAINGRIVSSKDVVVKNNKVKFFVKTNLANINNKKFNNLNSKILVTLDINDNYEDKIKIGNIVQINNGKLRTIKEATNPYQFDYKKYLENKDTKNVFYGKTSDLDFVKAPEFKGNFENKWYFILNRFENTRIKILSRHEQNIKSPYLEILGGIVFGNETINPDENVKENFKNAGLLHLLAASGLNVALIFGIWWWIANLIKIPYNLSILSGAIFVIFYTFMTGFPPSILRASLMLLFILLGKMFDKTANSIALLFFVGFLILIVSPKMFFDIGFQLSFIVTFGLIISCPVVIEKFNKLEEKFIEKHKNDTSIKKYLYFSISPKKLVSIVLVPLVAQLWVIPLQMHYFNNLSLLSVFANISVVFFIGILSFVGFISSIIALIPYLSEPIVYVFDMIAKPLLVLLVKISEFFASFKFSLVSTMGLSIFQMFSFWLILLLLLLNIKNNFKNLKHVFVFCSVIIIFLFSLINFDFLNKNLEIMMFDVENADSFLIKTPENKYIMIDTGRKTYKGITSATGVINPYLKNKRIKELEALVITHFDIDHCGGVIDVLNLVNAKNIYIQSERVKSEFSAQILEYLKDNNLNYKIAKNNDEIYSKNDLKIINFVAKDNSSSKDKKDNEESIITLLKYKDKNILFMADAGIVAFDNLQDYFPQKIDIIKIGHHGAYGVVNQKMLDRLKPDYALISTGVNKFNHPHFSTINLLNENNVKIVSTKNYGFTKIILNSDKIEFSHFEKGKFKEVLFEKIEKIPFHKSKWVQSFIENNI